MIIPEAKEFARAKEPLGTEKNISLEAESEETRWIKNRLKEHEKFRESPIGRTCLAIAERQIQEIVGLLCLPVTAFMNVFPNVPSEKICEVRAELRGRYSVWAQILSEPETLFARQKEFEGGKKKT